MSCVQALCLPNRLNATQTFRIRNVGRNILNKAPLEESVILRFGGIMGWTKSTVFFRNTP